MKTVNKVIIVVAVVMLAAIGILFYNIEGTTKWPYWCIVIPLIATRVYRAILIIGVKKGDKPL